MTDEKKKPDSEELSDKQLDDVSGGATSDATKPVSRTGYIVQLIAQP